MTVMNMPPQRRVPAMIYTPAGWISGEFVIPKLHTLLAFLNGSKGFVKLVDVLYIRTGQNVPFVAIQRDAMELILPSGKEAATLPGRTTAQTRLQSVSCFLDRGVVHGTIEVLHNTRVSDFLMQNQNYFALTDATVTFGTLADAMPQVVPLAIVNGHQLLAITNPRIDGVGQTVESEERVPLGPRPVAM